MKIEANHFRPLPDEAGARTLFRNSVGIVLIETSSYCNRRCSYCPNSRIDRISERKLIDAGLLSRVLIDLASIDYAGEVMLHSYNEPLANPRLPEEIQLARQALPRARIGLYSNGDFLTRPLLDTLIAAGLNSLRLSVHLGNDKPYRHEAVAARAEEMGRRLGLPVDIRHEPGVRIGALFQAPPPLELTLYQEDLGRLGSNRAGALPLGDQQERTRPCLHPFGAVYIDYNGFISPCCHMVPDLPEHRPYLAGHLNDYRSIFHAYTAPPLVQWRRALTGSQPKAPPCNSCNDLWRASPETDAAMELARRRFVEPAAGAV